MKRQKKLIILGVVSIIIVVLALILAFVPKLKLDLNGNSKIVLEVGSNYDELGASAYVTNLFSSKKKDVLISGEVDTSKVGKYVITYSVKNNNTTEKIERTIEVVDTKKPEITLNKPVTMCKNNNIIDLDVKATDNYDQDITDQVKYRVDGDYVYISVTDSSLNITEIKEELKYIDDEIPKITLKGSKTIYVNKDESYVEYGATANDSCDGVLTQDIKIENNVDTSKLGTYTVTYRVTDKNGHEAKITRSVIVREKEEAKPSVTNGVIYLTFDDGPGQYTESFLNVLAKYDVKATFFVTNQFPKYRSLIKKEYEAGHTVGIHTYSHKWTVYSSVDDYLNDFNKIEEIVYNETGVHPQIFRFPGGSSNTVSRKYAKGIMTELAKIMTEKGYEYFDWTFDSGDTSRDKNSKADIIKTVKTYLKGNGEYIILMHDLKKNTLDALPEIIEYAKKAGYVFKPITEDTTPRHFKIVN